jgi:hypothetical protein
MKAISAPNSGTRYFYYDKFLDSLFSVTVNDHIISPNYFNTVVVSETIIEDLNKEIEKVKAVNPDIVILPKLSQDQKIDFLTGYLSNASETNFKKYLNSVLENFSDQSEFFFGIDIKGKEPSEVFKFDMARGQFLTTEIEKTYSPLGISVKSHLIW